MAHFSKYSSGADKIGITSAVICGIHCLVIPAVFVIKYAMSDGFGGSLSEVWGSGLPHWWEHLDYIFLIVGLVAVYHAATHAPAKGVKIALWLFWLMLAVAVLFEDTLHWMAYLASFGLVATHYYNIRSHRLTKRLVNEQP